jgi:thiosulfate/3-mercaptopyruvate sulfurtransferase
MPIARFTIPLWLMVAMMATATARPAAATDSLVVSPSWLAARLGDPRLVILHVGSRPDYDREHIAGAHYVALSQISTRRGDVTLELPAVAQLDSTFESFGISDDSRIVLVFGGQWITPATRVFFTLDYLGLSSRTSMLDGGLDAWKRHGGAVTAAVPPAPARGRLTPRPRADAVASAEWVRDRLGGTQVAVIDARDRVFYDGTEPAGPRLARIPGARSIPFTTLADDSVRFLDTAAVRERFRAARVPDGGPVVAYCHVGQQATLVYFNARRLGYDVRLYDGSYTEWSARNDLPVETPPNAGLPRLVDTEGLARWIEFGRPMTILDARSDLASYLEGHVPGAAFLHNETLRATKGGVPADLLPSEWYTALFSQLGIRRDRPVVIYGTGYPQNFHATFLAWLLNGLGHVDVMVLDGGLAKWTAENRTIARAYPPVESSAFTADAFAPALATLEDVKGALGRSDAVLVDARPEDQFVGQAGAQMRRGHIPGAVSHPWATDLVQTDAGPVWKPLDQLRVSYESQGITPDKDVIVYCNTGTEASHLYFALRALLHYPRVRVYVPSWTEWAAREDLPIETGRTP